MIIHTGADVLLLDEPTAGLAEKKRGRLQRRLNCLKSGLTIIVVEHDLKSSSKSLKNYGYAPGWCFYEGDLQSTLNNVEVKNIYLGQLNESVLCFDYPRCVVDTERQLSYVISQ